jgi:hypothetical protein
VSCLTEREKEVEEDGVYNLFLELRDCSNQERREGRREGEEEE